MDEREPSHRRGKSICLPCESEAQYRQCVDEAKRFRRFIEQRWQQYPELFPTEFSQGFKLHDSYRSVKQDLCLRRIKLKATGAVFLVRPWTVLPYLSAKTADIENALYVRQWGVPLEALAYVFAREAMFYYRAWLSLGRHSIIGTTVKRAARLPEDLLADEKHTWRCGQSAYVAPTVAAGAMLGAARCAEASTDSLHAAYGEFVGEAREVAPDSQPHTGCTDGWRATRQAWQLLIPTVPLLLCFLPSVLKIAARCRGALGQELRQRAWHIYQAGNKAQFSQRIRRLRQWAGEQLQGVVQETGLKLCQLKGEFMVAYDFAQAARTTNGSERLMDYQDRVLYAMRYLHGTNESARLAVRAMAVQWNFHPYSGRAQLAGAKGSPFEALNGFQYHGNWLHNLLSAASMGGHRL